MPGPAGQSPVPMDRDCDWRQTDWNLTPAQARSLQEKLKSWVRVEPLDVDALQTVAGADLSMNRGSDTVYAGIVVLRLPELKVLEKSGLRTRTAFPYIPGLLSFRETPPLLEAWERLKTLPDALIFDGHGFAHPRRFGISCHLGVLLDLPTVGCGKSILCGKHEPVGPNPGDWTPLVDRGETIGAALRTRPGVAPIYVSIGHRCDLPSAIRLVRKCAGATRVPETTRLAHGFVNALRVEELMA